MITIKFPEDREDEIAQAMAFGGLTYTVTKYRFEGEVLTIEEMRLDDSQAQDSECIIKFQMPKIEE